MCTCGGGKEVPLKPSALGKSLCSFYSLSSWGETKATSAELPKCWQTKNYWKCCESTLEVPSNITLIFLHFFLILWKEKQNFHLILHQILSKDNTTCQLLTIRLCILQLKQKQKELETIPKKIIHPDDVLLICILGINSYGGTRLYPNVASVLLHPTVILRHTLALIQHWG